MKKDKEAYMNFVCPHCWYTLNKCTCDIFPPYHLIFVDKNIQEHIRLLNEKGYNTTGCCEGHQKICISTYIAFPEDYFEELGVAEGFKYNKKRGMIIYDYSQKLTEEKMEELKAEKLKVLLDWIKSLPNRNTK